MPENANGGKRSEESVDDLDGDNRVLDGCVMPGVSSSPSVYRVRIFTNDSMNEVDEYGRKCSFWCMKNGYVASGALMLLALPENIQRDGEACKNYIRGMDNESLNDLCKECKQFYSVEGVKFVHTYKYFVEMKAGDIVVMQIKGEKGKTPHPLLVFGVIQDESLILMSKDEARKEHGFPWDFKKWDRSFRHNWGKKTLGGNNNKVKDWHWREKGNVRGFDNGIMLRKVKWYRQGILQDVRGSSQADWLDENITKWMSKVGGTENVRLKKALRIMRSEKFIGSTKEIEEAWIDDG